MHFISRPDSSEYATYYRKYVDLVPDGNILDTLLDQSEGTRTLGALKDDEALVRPGPGKWNIKEIIGHLIDTERIFAYRALRIARGDETPMPGYEQDDYVLTGGFSDRPFGSLLDELQIVRKATVALLGTLPEEAITRRGIANDNPVSVRALAWIIAGHERHHVKIIREQYLKK